MFLCAKLFRVATPVLQLFSVYLFTRARQVAFHVEINDTEAVVHVGARER